MFFCVDIEIQCRCAGFFCCSDDSPRVGGVDGSTDVFVVSVKKMGVGKNFFVLFFCCFYVMPMFQTGGSDLCIRNIRQKMCGGEVSVLSGGARICGRWTRFWGRRWRCMAYSWFDQWWCNQCFIFVALVFVLMMVVGMGGAQCKK